MDVNQIKGLGNELMDFLGEFDDCFGRSEPREHLRTYVCGQLSDLPRKSVEPIALAAGVPPRTLQRFLESIRWDEHRMRDRTQSIVVRDHAHPKAIGVIDESGNPKKGRHTATVKRQWCGNTGKVDNCVVAVHLGYVAGDFQCLLDSDLFLPEEWANDPVRREEAGIPDDVEYRPKPAIALEQIGRALGNGVRVAAWTFDELYGRDRGFLNGLDALGQNYVGEVPSNFTGWVHPPQVLLRPTPQERRKRGRRRRFPRLARKALPASEVRNLLKYSPVFQKQSWQRFHIKDGEKGPMVWEVKHVCFYRKHGRDGLPGPTHTLIVARNVLDPKEVKYFISNMVPGQNGVTLQWLLWVAFSRWPIERCFEFDKAEVGMDHFEVRLWCAIHRHLYVTQVSQLFCARVHQGLREKNDFEFVPDRGAGSGCGIGVGRSASAAAVRSSRRVSQGRRTDRLLPAPQSPGETIAYEEDPAPPSRPWHRSCPAEVLRT
jgi:SRSO17 transposase